MTNLLYLRLACNNLWKNRRTYLPFVLASVLLTFAQYSFTMITFNPGFSEVHGGANFVMILQFGLFVVGLFTAIFLFYANSFLIKRRKKELGLYAILGMEKKHIARVLRHELSLSYLLSMVFGLGLGVLLSRLLFLLIRLAVRIDVPLTSSVSWPAVGVTAVLFAVLYLLLMLFNGIQVATVSPIALLRGGQTGEREPKANWVLAVLGLLCMGAGYWIAQTVTNAMAAIALFFIAVILVIVGTYLLFLTGSIAVLKLLKNNKRYYYSSKHFVTVSGMLYRMRQNAAGLASIAILCTMAMLTIGTTVALYNGSEKMLSEYYPYDMQFSMKNEQARDEALAVNDSLAAEAGVTLESLSAYDTYENSFVVDAGKLLNMENFAYNSLEDFNRAYYALTVTEATFARVEGSALDLAPDELGWCSAMKCPSDTLTFGGKTYRLRQQEAPSVDLCFSQGTSFNKVILVVPDEETALAMLAETDVPGDTEEKHCFTAHWNLSGTDEQKAAYYAAVDAEESWHSYSQTRLRVKDSLREEWYAMHGGLLFAGIFLGSIFLMGTALILYFKQISEGYQDHDRFIILQKVGMSQHEVKQTVRRQILIVFFLPLLVAVCHTAGALHMMTLCLQLFGLMDVPYIALNTFGAAFGVALLYLLFYWRTAKSYYKLVRF